MEEQRIAFERAEDPRTRAPKPGPRRRDAAGGGGAIAARGNGQTELLRDSKGAEQYGALVLASEERRVSGKTLPPETPTSRDCTHPCARGGAHASEGGRRAEEEDGSSPEAGRGGAAV